jgi:DNA-binding LacI/PurR family transcriptional regulator
MRFVAELRRWEELADSIRKKIESGDLTEGSKLPSDEELSRIWNVSRATSHRALHELQRQGLVIRQRRWGTVVAPKASTLKGVVALLFDQLAPAAGFPQPNLLKGIQEGLGPETSLLLCDSMLDPRREAEFAVRMAQESDGMICFPTGNRSSIEAFQKVIDARKPLVFLDRLPSGMRADLVENDRAGAAEMAMQTLLGRGHRRIAYLGFSKPNVSAETASIESYRNSLRLAGIDVDPKLERHFHPELEFIEFDNFLLSVRDAIFTLTRQAFPATAVLCAQDMIASALLDVCDDLEVNVPRDLEVATFNDWPQMMLRSSHRLHRITSRHYQIGQTAAQRFKELSQDPNSDPATIRVPANFYIAEFAQERAGDAPALP